MGDKVGCGMQVTQVSTSVGGAPVNGAKTWLIDAAVDTGPARVFRQVLYVHFVLDGNADGMTIVPAQTRCRGRFLAYDYAADQVANPALAAQLSNVDKAVLIELDAPRQLRAVRLNSTLAPGASSQVTVHRVDGPQVVAVATTAAGWESAFSAFRTELSNDRLPHRQTAQATSGGLTALSQAQKLTRALTVATFTTDFTDARFGLRLSNSPTTLTTNHLAGVTVRSYPSAPRLGLADSNNLAAPTFFLRLAGEIGKDDIANAGEFTADPLLVSALQQQINALFAQRLAAAAPKPPTLPQALDVALVIESDAPCQLQLTEFAIGYLLARRNFPDYAEKQTLHFAGASVESQSLPLALPSAATVTQATLTVVPKLQAVAFAEQSAPAVLPPETLPQATGIHLGLARWAAQPLTPAQALTASGVVLALLALTANAQLTLELYEDWQGQPAGKQLAAQTVDLAHGGVRRWQTVRFTDVVPLFVQPYWLLLKAVRGAALWLAQPGTPPVQMLTAEKPRWQPISVLVNTQGLYHLLVPAVATKQSSALAVYINDVLVTTPPVTSGDRQHYDVTASLNMALAAATTINTVTPSLRLVTGLAGTVTVYPPEIRYAG